MSETIFIELPCDDCEAAPLSGCVLTVFSSASDAVSGLAKSNMIVGKRDFKLTYTAGHYGETEHQWSFSHYEIYEPQDRKLPSMVILRYRPCNPDAAEIFYTEAVLTGDRKKL